MTAVTAVMAMTAVMTVMGVNISCHCNHCRPGVQVSSVNPPFKLMIFIVQLATFMVKPVFSDHLKK